MRIALLPIFTIFICGSCLTNPTEKVIQESGSNKKLIRYIFIDDVEENSYEHQSSPLNINDSIIDSSYITEYIKRKTILLRGNIKKIHLIFNVSNNLDIKTLGEIINLCDETIKTLYPDLAGVVEIQFLYSSKNNDWLILPHPPKL